MASHLGWSHPLAPVARRMCRAGHLLACNGMLGRVACGRHWEQAIRTDERVAVEHGLESPHPPVDRGYLDPVAIQRAMAGDQVRLTLAERIEVERLNTRRDALLHILKKVA